MDLLQQATQQSAQQNQPPDPEQVLQATNQALVKKKSQLIDSMDQLPPDNRAALSQALAQANPNSKNSTIQIGKSIATPAYAGLCLKWVDDKQGNTNRQPTAYADYIANAKAGNISTSADVPKGARVYFSPNASNGNMGHVGIANGDNTFTSATDNGIKTYNIKDWEKATGQQYLGFASES